MDKPLNDKRAKILESAIQTFARYGFRRSSMEDIAVDAGMSRPALYQHFRNKAEIFREGSARMQAAAIEAAVAAGRASQGPLAERLAEMMIVYKLPAWRIAATTPHGRELLDVNAEIAEDVSREAAERMVAVIAETIAPEIGGDIDPHDAARLLSIAAYGVIERATTEAEFDRDIRLLAKIWATAARTPPA